GGTLDEMTASAWVAERAREAGLQPAGDNGTYFQCFPLERSRVSTTSTVTLAGKSLRMGRDVVPDNTVRADVDAAGLAVAPDALEGAAVTGKALVVRYVSQGPAPTTPPSPGRAPVALRNWIRNIQGAVAARNPAAIVALVPADAADQWERVSIALPRGTY